MRRNIFTIIYNKWLSVTFKGNNDDYLGPAPKERHVDPRTLQIAMNFLEMCEAKNTSHFFSQLI